MIASKTERQSISGSELSFQADESLNARVHHLLSDLGFLTPFQSSLGASL
jgi:hypothetical protein